MNLTDYLDLELISKDMQLDIFKALNNQWHQYNPSTTIKPMGRMQSVVQLKGNLVEERYTDYPLPGFKAYLWRIAGAIMNKVAWWKRGVFTQKSGAHWSIRDLKVAELGFSRVHPFAPDHRVIIQLRAAYDAWNDTLYIYRDIYREQVK